MATLWRLFLSLLSPSSLRLVHLDLSLYPLYNLPFENLQICWVMGVPFSEPHPDAVTP